MTGLDRLKRQLVAAATQSKPRVPEAGRLLWKAFVALHNARTVSMAGAQAITHGEIEVWVRVSCTPLQAHHVEILRAMDDAWLRKARSSGPEKTSTGGGSLSAQVMTPALFDAVFG